MSVPVTRKFILLGATALPLMLLGPSLDPAAGTLRLTGVAVAQNHAGGGGGEEGSGGGHEGGGGGGHESGGGGHEGGGGSGSGSQGPNPNCPYQDHSGRGGYGPGGRHAGTTPGSDSPQTTLSTDPGVTGGGAGGEAFVCDMPGGGSVVNRVFRR